MHMRVKHSFASRADRLYLRSMMTPLVVPPPSGVVPAAASSLLAVESDLVAVLIAVLVAAATATLVHLAVGVRARRRPAMRVVERAPRIASRDAA